MIKCSMKEKLLIACLACACLTVNAQKKSDPVVMTIAGKQIPLSEFVFIAEKNGEVNLSDSKSVRNYVELFKNFKLKVAEAEALGLDKTKAFNDELDEYRAQLVTSYLSDKEGEDAAVRNIYNRYGEALELRQVVFRLPLHSIAKDTVAAYQNAMQFYDRIKNGEDFETVGQALMEKDKDNVFYNYLRCLLPMQTTLAFENAVYAMKPGTVSLPVRTSIGMHVIQLISRKPNPGLVRVSQILIAFPKDSVADSDVKTLAKAEEVYQKAKSGADFEELVKQYSDDSNAKNGGALPPFALGEMIEPFEKAAFSLENPGDISEPVKTKYGYHIIKLLAKPTLPTFDAVKKLWAPKMAQDERNFDYYHSFVEKMKKEYGYVFYPEAYAELQTLCNNYFPTDSAFGNEAKNMHKVLFRLNGEDVEQNAFAAYMQKYPFSTKTYSADFMNDVYQLFIREMVTAAERKNLTVKHPEFNHLMQEYRDGILLFDISNKEVWSKPVAERDRLETEWIKRLNSKYPVSINWQLLKKLKK
jgi:peptidyl-prolyl cis-trans isomerase SurA